MSPRRALPIDSVIPEICESLATAGAVVLQAEPGAGKTTRVPTALLDAGFAGEGAILVLEPRRVAARAGADFVASERGEPIGEGVGFQVRFEKRGSAATRVWFVTEGIAVRRLVSDPFLEGVGVIVLDEFHERHLPGDIVLAIARELRRTVRPDLKIVVMSATLDVERISRFLDDCPVIRCPGRVYPVEIEYRANERDLWVADNVVRAVRDLVTARHDDGDILVFLPGIGEIRRAERALSDSALAGDFQVLPLHGDLPLDAQRRVLRKSGGRRIVLATNVAESSVTVDGVTAVVDSGLARVPEVDVARGVERLRLMPISIASADQRAGRAGRQASGRCVRLWSKHDHASRRDREVPEIRRLDLTATVLELRAWGLGDLESLAWLDPPSSGALEAAARLLFRLGALDGDGEVSDVGRAMIRLAAPPRAARLAIETARLGHASVGAVAGAVLSEREIAMRARAPGARETSDEGKSDLATRCEMFETAVSVGFDSARCRASGIEGTAARAVDRARRQLLRSLEGRVLVSEERIVSVGSEEALLRGALVAFSDRLVRRRAAGDRRGVMVGGGGVRLADDSCVGESELFVAIEVRAGERRKHAESTVYLASAVERTWLDEYFPAEIEKQQLLDFDEVGERVVRVDREVFRGLVLSEDRRPTKRGAGSELLVQRAQVDPERVINLSGRGAMLLRRVEFAAGHGFEAAGGGSRALLRSAIEVHAVGIDGFAELRSRITDAAIENAMTFDQRRDLDRLAPETFRLPGGRSARIDYGRVGGPAISARIQELFGLVESPRVAGGAVVVGVEILGPNQRPVQMTDDLASFWENTYPQIRKELRGRYPKHDWPEDPWNAVARSRVGRSRKTRE